MSASFGVLHFGLGYDPCRGALTACNAGLLATPLPCPAAAPPLATPANDRFSNRCNIGRPAPYALAGSARQQRRFGLAGAAGAGPTESGRRASRVVAEPWLS